jgi:hypothetical protein
MGCLPSSSSFSFFFFFVARSQFDWSIAHKLSSYEGSRKQKVLFWSIYFLPFGPCIIGERRTTFAQAYGIKVRCYGEHVGEHIGNLMRIHWELEGKIVRTHWEPGNNEKKLLPLPT